MGVTIKDIAKRTGLSITTISLVLNKKENRISEKTKQIVESAAQELNYSPNQAAISLSTKKTNTIGLIIPAGAYYLPADLLASMEHACRNSGYSLVLSLPEGDGDSCLEAIQDMLRRGTDGIVVDSGGLGEAFYQPYIDLVLKTETPISSLAGAGAQLLANSIMPDHRKGGYLAASHLLELGHSKIGCIPGPRTDYTAADFYLGFRDALEERNLDGDFLPVLFSPYTAASGYGGLDQLLAPEPGLTAIITGSDTIASGLLRRAFERGIAIPRDLSVTGYGNSAIAADIFVPLTTISVHFDRIVRKAVNLIKKLNDKGPPLTPELIQPSLIIRNSTSPPATVAPHGHAKA
ncbi:LacI family transcriptional regulator [Spirochaetia bacterium]|nr:LacI family transcriptional regulator [Spirochaetia bacterium]